MSFGADAHELERLAFFEQALEQAKQDYKANNKDSLALTRWGGALLELAHFRQSGDSLAMFEEAVVKFKMALAIDPKRHDAMWCLGNAYTSLGFITHERPKANHYFGLAKDCFKNASREDPGNEVYKKALEMALKAPELHAELQNEIQRGNQATLGGGMAAPAVAKGRDNSAFWYDVAGWAILGALVFVCLSTTKPSPAPAPPAK